MAVLGAANSCSVQKLCHCGQGKQNNTISIHNRGYVCYQHNIVTDT